MADVLWYATLGANLGSIAACWVTVVWGYRRDKRDEQAQFLRWKTIEEEQHRAWMQRMHELQAACPLCGLASAEEEPLDMLSS